MEKTTVVELNGEYREENTFHNDYIENYDNFSILIEEYINSRELLKILIKDNELNIYGGFLREAILNIMGNGGTLLSHDHMDNYLVSNGDLDLFYNSRIKNIKILFNYILELGGNITIGGNYNSRGRRLNLNEIKNNKAIKINLSDQNSYNLSVPFMDGIIKVDISHRFCKTYKAQDFTMNTLAFINNKLEYGHLYINDIINKKMIGCGVLTTHNEFIKKIYRINKFINKDYTFVDDNPLKIYISSLFTKKEIKNFPGTFFNKIKDFIEWEGCVEIIGEKSENFYKDNDDFYLYKTPTREVNMKFSIFRDVNETSTNYSLCITV